MFFIISTSLGIFGCSTPRDCASLARRIALDILGSSSNRAFAGAPPLAAVLSQNLRNVVMPCASSMLSAYVIRMAAKSGLAAARRCESTAPRMPSSADSDLRERRSNPWPASAPYRSSRALTSSAWTPSRSRVSPTLTHSVSVVCMYGLTSSLCSVLCSTLPARSAAMTARALSCSLGRVAVMPTIRALAGAILSAIPVYA